MIVKILSSAGNFEGIDYSERKNDLGKSRLLKAENFGAVGHNSSEVRKADYINYMKLICDANPRVKKRQFHAVISAKGQSYTSDQLADMAEQYLKSMGYGETPYLIYHHSDTDNNHVHMVSTRVDKNGNKVNDSYEKIKSQKILQDILQQDPAIEAKSAIDHALEYNFSTKAQLKLLLELDGFKTSEKEGQLNIIKYGTIQSKLPVDEIDKRLAAYEPPEDRVKQLKSIFQKYKKGLELEAFQKKLHQKIGVELVFHRNKNHEKPYGYTIIDHPKKQVFKGSQVMPLRELQWPVSLKEREQLLRDFLYKVEFEKETFRSLKKSLVSMGFQINAKGEISSLSDQQKLVSLNFRQLNHLKYNSKLAMAAEYAVNSPEEMKVLSKLFNIRPEHISITQNLSEDIKNYYKDLLINANPGRSINEILDAKKLEIIQFQSNYFLLDKTNKCLFEIKSLLNGETIDLRDVKIRDLDHNNDQIIDHSNTNKISQLSQLFDVLSSEQEQRRTPKKNKKKQRSI